MSKTSYLKTRSFLPHRSRNKSLTTNTSQDSKIMYPKYSQNSQNHYRNSRQNVVRQRKSINLNAQLVHHKREQNLQARKFKNITVQKEFRK
ncbi:unnamed protein product [Moneuplotes crassus]|uniref:Uncharacterized protein n=1 Tax=Euplotes crassus TaxID=5936 RepID=A0AAD1UN28_EUPCR|nr:unnamed protein product [Moneuplotes crassus]